MALQSSDVETKAARGAGKPDPEPNIVSEETAGDVAKGADELVGKPLKKTRAGFGGGGYNPESEPDAKPNEGEGGN